MIGFPILVMLGGKAGGSKGDGGTELKIKIKIEIEIKMRRS